MTVAVTFVAFLVVVLALAAVNARRTRGRACCAPADPARDLRMRGSTDTDASPARAAGQG